VLEIRLRQMVTQEGPALRPGLHLISGLGL